MIVFNFSEKKFKQPKDAWFSTITDWSDISETLLFGDVQFSVNGLEFGVANNYIIGVVDSLVVGADRALFYENRVRLSYPGHFENILFERQGSMMKVASFHGRQMIQEAVVDTGFLCREIGKFSNRVVWHLFEKYPLIESRFPSLTGCPHGSLRSYYHRTAKDPSLSQSFYDSFGDSPP